MSDVLRIIRSFRFSKLNREMEGYSVMKPLDVSFSQREVGNYCRATGDNIEKYDLEKMELPPFYFSRFVYNEMKEILMDSRLRVNFFKMVHAWQSVEFLNVSQQAGMDRAEYRIQNIKDTPTGEAFEIETTCYTVDIPVMKSITGFIVRNGSGKRNVARYDGGGGHKTGIFSEIPFETYVGQEMDYANISGDRNLIHTNTLAAKLAGFKGKILHGLCSMTVVSNSLIREILKDNWKSMNSLNCRFSGPVYPGEDLTILYSGPKKKKYEFIVKNSRGREVLRNGEFQVK